MVSPSQRRAVLAWAQQAYQVSERRACRGFAIHRAMIRDRSVKPDDAPVRRRLQELAKDRPAFGVKRLHTMLRRDGLVINLKKVRRLYLEEQLQLKPRRRRRRSSTVRVPRVGVGGPNERWAMDFMHDVLATGQHVRVFTLVDVYSRECVALAVAKSFSGADVARLLSDVRDCAGTLPPIIQCDNGTEFTSTALDHWAYWNRVQLDFSRPGNRWTTPSAKPSTARSDVSASRVIGLLRCLRRRPSSRHGARTTTTCGPIPVWGCTPRLNTEQAGTTSLGHCAEKLTLLPGPDSGTQAVTSAREPGRGHRDASRGWGAASGSRVRRNTDGSRRLTGLAARPQAARSDLTNPPAPDLP